MPAVIDGYPVYAIENLRSPILTHVVVSEGIEVIGDSAFKAYFDYEKGYIRTLVSVSLPQSLKIISDDGFWGQENLQEITLGSVVEIGQSAFGSCTMLKQITLPDTLTTIGWRAFESSGLTSLTIPVNVTSLGDSFITDCSALTSLYVAEGNPTYEMEDGLLYDIPAKTLRYALPDVSGDVVIRDGTVRIGDDVFKEHAITSVQLPDSLQKIGNCAFQFCKELKEITFPEGLITIDGLAFAYCTQLENVVLPEGLKSLGDSAFRSCDSLTEITVPEGITFMSGTFATC